MNYETGSTNTFIHWPFYDDDMNSVGHINILKLDVVKVDDLGPYVAESYNKNWLKYDIQSYTSYIFKLYNLM